MPSREQDDGSISHTVFTEVPGDGCPWKAAHTAVADGEFCTLVVIRR
jgi:hypothetical protein